LLGRPSEIAEPGVVLKEGATDAVATAFAPFAVTKTGKLFGGVFVSGAEELNAISAYSAPVVPPPRQMPVPARPGVTLPTVGVVGDPAEHAVVTFDDPAVIANVVVSDVPATLAEIETVPGDEPRVTWVLA
jgi:hypothetical protein